MFVLINNANYTLAPWTVWPATFAQITVSHRVCFRREIYSTLKRSALKVLLVKIEISLEENHCGELVVRIPIIHLLHGGFWFGVKRVWILFYFCSEWMKVDKFVSAIIHISIKI